MPGLSSEFRNDPMRERLPGRFLERRLKDQPVLELADDHHLRDRVLQPCVDLSEHVVNIRVDEPVKLIGVEAKPGCRLGGSNRNIDRDNLPPAPVART